MCRWRCQRRCRRDSWNTSSSRGVPRRARPSAARAPARAHRADETGSVLPNSTPCALATRRPSSRSPAWNPDRARAARCTENRAPPIRSRRELPGLRRSRPRTGCGGSPPGGPAPGARRGSSAAASLSSQHSAGRGGLSAEGALEHVPLEERRHAPLEQLAVVLEHLARRGRSTPRGPRPPRPRGARPRSGPPAARPGRRPAGIGAGAVAARARSRPGALVHQLDEALEE